MTQRQIVVIGGGLAGLTAAATAGRAGAEVTLFEARTSEGGRARTDLRARGACFNEGPHALYADTAGWQVLGGLGITPTGQRPPSRAWGRYQGRVDRLPATNIDALRTGLIGIKAKAQLGKLLANPSKALRTDLSGSFADWIDRQVRAPDARALLEMIGRVGTYVDDPTAIAAEATVPQIIGALTSGVRYLDGGWQQIVDALHDAAERAGVKIHVETKPTGIARTGDRLTVTTDVNEVTADAVIVAAGGPRQAANLIGDLSPVAATWESQLRPAFIASLDLHLAKLPNPDRRAVFGLDAPLYFSSHTPSAQLAPEGGEVVHAAYYGDPAEDPRPAIDAFCDEVQPGWRAEVIDERYGRRLVATYGRPEPATGFAGRPGPAIPDCPGVFVAGDWVGARGLLADAALASGRDAAELAVVG
jgi:phytoene dehydrogenase-like protein